MLKRSLKTRMLLFILIAERIRGFIHFGKGINPKINIIERLEFELANYDVIAYKVNHYATGTLFPVDSNHFVI